jgi:hypothetical protein
MFKFKAVRCFVTKGGMQIKPVVALNLGRKFGDQLKGTHSFPKPEALLLQGMHDPLRIGIAPGGCCNW